MSNAAVTAATVDTVRATLLDTFRRNVRLSLLTVRDVLSAMPRAELDAALIALQREGTIVLYRNDNTRSLTAEQHAAALTVGDSPRHLVYIAS